MGPEFSLDFPWGPGVPKLLVWSAKVTPLIKSVHDSELEAIIPSYHPDPQIHVLGVDQPYESRIGMPA